MEKYNVLILTDHRKHSAENSLYKLAQAMKAHPRCSLLDVATRGNTLNQAFFEGKEKKEISVCSVNQQFAFHEDGRYLMQELKTKRLQVYDLIWLRLPPPLSPSFLDFLDHTFSKQVIINNPKGIYETGSKEFLMNFPTLCPPMRICKTIEDIIEFKNQFPIVLKPFREYGGRGIVRIDKDKVWEEKEEKTFGQFINGLDTKNINYLAVKFLKNVSKGDKRIIVVDGKIMGASLRLPSQGSWMCNVAMGGTSHLTTVEKEEEQIVINLHPALSTMGIVMYGLDTLVNDKGKRVLSEINTTSIGGLPQIAVLRNQPQLLEQAINLIWNYFIKNKQRT